MAAEDKAGALEGVQHRPGHLALWVGGVLAPSAIVWLEGFLLRAPDQPTRNLVMLLAFRAGWAS